MKSLFVIKGAIACSILFAASCSKNLDRYPINTTTSKEVFSTADGVKSALAKVYGSYATTGSGGPGSGDLAGIDAGTSDFLRLYWMAQELTTDEASCAWTADPGILPLSTMTWDPNNPLLNGLYNRSIYQITVANAFLRQSNGNTAANANDLKHYRAEARFLRAYQYWVLMDLFGNPPFVDESTPVGKVEPPRIARAELFKYVESELKAIDADLAAPKANEYGRADKAAAWALLARLYLNAKVYTGQDRYNDAATYAQKVIQSSYNLKTDYAHLFMSDNNLNNPEIILSINYDGNKTQNWGGMTFLIRGSSSSDEKDFGIPTGGWGGLVARKNLPKLFGDDYKNSPDKRAKLLAGDTYDITDMSKYAQGIKVHKFNNKKSDGTTPAGAQDFASTDFPLFRLAEQYLIYAEAVLRGATGSQATALQYVNDLRSRANATPLTSINLDDVLAERGRELYWEGFRRTDLIRYDKFTSSSYLWQWKGNTQNGMGVSSDLNVFPIPASDLGVNSNLLQNPGYAK